MFCTLLMKEIHDTVTNGKFLLATMLCLVLIPFGFHMSLQEYKQQLQDYQNMEQLYQERSQGYVGAMFNAEGYRPPSALSVFASGIEDQIPNKAVTSNLYSSSINRFEIEGIVKISNEKGIGNPQSAMFGRIDYLFNVSVILSILILFLIVTGITAEREHGTLKLVMSNSVPRGKFLISKFLGGYLVFLAPFVLSFIVGLIMLAVSPAFPLDDSGNPGAISVIFGASLLFLACMFSLGILISTGTGNSMTAMIGVMLAWVAITLIIPKGSPMIARFLHPVESDDVVANRISISREEWHQTRMRREEEVFAAVCAKYGVTTMAEYRVLPEEGAKSVINQEFEDQLVPVRNEIVQDMTDETVRLLSEQANKKLAQQKIVISLSRLSPVCCFTYLVSDIAGTGVLGLETFTRQAEQFQQRVKQEVYDKYIYVQYGMGGTSMGIAHRCITYGKG